MRLHDFQKRDPRNPGGQPIAMQPDGTMIEPIYECTACGLIGWTEGARMPAEGLGECPGVRRPVTAPNWHAMVGPSMPAAPLEPATGRRLTLAQMRTVAQRIMRARGDVAAQDVDLLAKWVVHMCDELEQRGAR